MDGDQGLSRLRPALRAQAESPSLDALCQRSAKRSRPQSAVARAKVEVKARAEEPRPKRRPASAPVLRKVAVIPEARVLEEPKPGPAATGRHTTWSVVDHGLSTFCI